MTINIFQNVSKYIWALSDQIYMYYDFFKSEKIPILF